MGKVILDFGFCGKLSQSRALVPKVEGTGVAVSPLGGVGFRPVEVANPEGVGPGPAKLSKTDFGFNKAIQI